MRPNQGKSYQQKIVCNALGLNRHRIDYLFSRVDIKPKIESTGTGTLNLFDFGGVVSFDIADILCMWGFNFKKIRSLLDEIQKQFPAIFREPGEDDSDAVSMPQIDKQVILVVVGIPGKRRKTDFISYISKTIIDYTQNIKKQAELFQKPYGLLMLNLSLRRYWVKVKLDLIK